MADSRRRPILTYSNVVSSLALFAALGGSTWAATSRLVSSSGTINGCVSSRGTLTIVKPGRRCPRHTTPISFSQRGPAGAPGPQGPPGQSGPQGPLPGTLPSGHTLFGAFSSVGFTSEPSSQHFSYTAVSFPAPLAAAPVAHFMFKEQAPTTECPGSPAEPTAAPGNLCVYESGQSSDATPTIDEPGHPGTQGASRFGFLVADAPGFKGDFSFGAWGSWAVTAP